MTTFTGAGATPEEWKRLAELGILWVPVASWSAELAAACPGVKDLGKCPSGVRGHHIYMQKGWADGLPASEALRAHDQSQGFGALLGVGELYAIDVDCDDRAISDRIMAMMEGVVTADQPLPIRTRGEASSRWAVLVRVHGWGAQRKKSDLPQIEIEGGGAVEVLGFHNQIVMAGTHPSGERYHWPMGMQIVESDAQTMDAFLARLASEIGQLKASSRSRELMPMPRREIPQDGHLSACRRVIMDKVAVLAETAEGARHETLVSVGIRCLRAAQTAGSDVTIDEVRELLMDAALECGLPEDEARKTIASLDPERAGALPEPWRQSPPPIESVVVTASDQPAWMDEVPLPDAEYAPTATPAPTTAEVMGPETYAEARAKIISKYAIYETQKDGSQRMIIPRTVEVLRAICDHPVLIGWEGAFDTFRGEIVCRRAGDGDESWRSPDDAVVQDILIHIERFGLGSMLSKASQIEKQWRASCTAHKLDSMQAWLDQHIPRWDGVKRVESFFATYCGAEESAYASALGRYLFAALWGRAASTLPMKADCAIILIGRQGCRKSTLVRTLAFDRDDWTTDAISLADSDTDLARKIRGVVTAEIPELSGMSRRAIAELKDFLSKSSDRWTEKYQCFAQTQARRCIYVMTTNDRAFLQDVTGARRMGIIEVGDIDIDAVRRDLPQLWAEGRQLFADANAGEERFTDSLIGRPMSGVARYQSDVERHISERHSAYLIEEPWCDALARWLADHEGEDLGWLMTSSNILFHALQIEDGDQTREHAKRLRDAMSQLGWSQKVVWDQSKKKSVRAFFRGDSELSRT